LAVSIENTLYIDPLILDNPKAVTHWMHGIRRVQGNVGMPGLTLIGWFTTKYNLDVKKPDPNNWQIVDHHPFDGKLEDYFSSTSLHIRFTGYSQALDFGAHNRIANGTVVEAVVSAFDQGQWVGDIHVVEAFRVQPSLHIISRHPGCRGSSIDKIPQRELVTIENWEEFLSPHPSLPGVVKCYGNWQARLTAVSLCGQLGYRALLFENHGCWDCAFKTLDNWNQMLKPIPISTRTPVPERRSSTLSSSTDPQEDSETEEGSNGATGGAENDLEHANSDRRETENHGGSAATDDASSISSSSGSESDTARFVPKSFSRRLNLPIIFIL
jgi:hypothetical protein